MALYDARARIWSVGVYVHALLFFVHFRLLEPHSLPFMCTAAHASFSRSCKEGFFFCCFFFSVSDVTVLRISLSELFLFFLYLSSLLQGKSHVTIKRSNEFVTFMSFYFSMHSCIQRFSLSN